MFGHWSMYVHVALACFGVVLVGRCENSRWTKTSAGKTTDSNIYIYKYIIYTHRKTLRSFLDPMMRIRIQTLPVVWGQILGITPNAFDVRRTSPQVLAQWVGASEAWQGKWAASVVGIWQFFQLTPDQVKGLCWTTGWPTHIKVLALQITRWNIWRCPKVLEGLPCRSNCLIVVRHQIQT